MQKTNSKPTRSRFTLLRQLCNLIPNHLVPTLARQYDVEAKSRTFRPWSHVVSLLYAQLTHALGLNDVCDALRLHAGPLSAIRGATPPSKNALSHANRERDAAMAEALFWNMLEHFQHIAPQFGGSGRRPRFAFRFKQVAADSVDHRPAVYGREGERNGGFREPVTGHEALGSEAIRLETLRKSRQSVRQDRFTGVDGHPPSAQIETCNGGIRNLPSAQFVGEIGRRAQRPL